MAARRVAQLRSRANPLAAILRQPSGAVGVPLVALICVCAVLAPALAPYDPAKQVLLDGLLAPSRDHLLGTDEFGRDTLSRTIFGARASLQVGLVAVVLSALAGTLIGQ